MEHIFSRSNYVLKYRFSRKNTFFDIPIILPSAAGLSKKLREAVLPPYSVDKQSTVGWAGKQRRSSMADHSAIFYSCVATGQYAVRASKASVGTAFLWRCSTQRLGSVSSLAITLHVKAHTLNQMQSKWLVTLRDTFMDHHTKVLQTGIEWNYRNDNSMVRPVGSDVSELS